MKRIHTIALGIALGLASLTAASAFPSSKAQQSAKCPPCGEPVPTCSPTSPSCGPS
ncbi:MAG TPA: hypothetical protein VGN16_03305 [Acidobacteriaceae bacterium]|jgi:hypothetical protein